MEQVYSRERHEYHHTGRVLQASTDPNSKIDGRRQLFTPLKVAKVFDSEVSF